MISELVLKEIKQNSFLAKKGYKKIFSLISSIFLLALFIFIEVILYLNIYDKVNVFANLNASLFSIVLFILFIFGTISSINMFYKAFFKNEKEKIILGTSPVSTYDVILAKSINIYLKLLIFSFSTIFVFSLTYGLKGELGFLFHCLMFFSTLLMALLMLLLGAIFVIPFFEIKKIVTRYKLISFIFVIVFLVLASLLYASILNLFVNLIRDDDIGVLFTTERVELLNEVAKYLYPVSSFIEFSNLENMNINFVIILAFVIILYSISIFIFSKYLTAFYEGRLERNVKKRSSNYQIKLTSLTRALVEKELHLAISNSEGIFSFLSLVIIEPFIIFSVVSAVNLIFSTGNLNYISTLFPSIFLVTDVLLILLFLAVINTQSSLSLTKEKDTLLVMKTMPVSYFKQLLIKVLVPSIISFVSYLISIIILVSFGEIDLISFIFLLLIGAFTIMLLNLSSLYNDLKMKGASSLLTLTLGFVLPLVSVVLGAALSLLVEAEQEIYVFFSAILALDIIALLFFIIKIKSRVTNLFMKYEGEAR